MPSPFFKIKPWFVSVALAMLSMFCAPSAHAADGCKFLLCIAGPWSSISQCVPTVHEVFHDLARGRPFPTCDMSGPGNSASNEWTNVSSCPSMYRQYDWESGNYSGCSYPGRISVFVNGALWSQVYWTEASNATWYSDTARTSLTSSTSAPSLDPAFQNDLAAWNTAKLAECRMNGGTPSYDAFGAVERCNTWWSYGDGGR